MALRITMKEGDAFNVKGALCVVMEARKGQMRLAIISEGETVYREGHFAPEEHTAVAELKQQAIRKRDDFRGDARAYQLAQRKQD